MTNFIGNIVFWACMHFIVIPSPSNGLISQGVKYMSDTWGHTPMVTLSWCCYDDDTCNVIPPTSHCHGMHCCRLLVTCCQSQTWDKDSNKWQHLHHEDLGLDHNCHKDITFGTFFSSKAPASSSVYIQVMLPNFGLIKLDRSYKMHWFQTQSKSEHMETV